MQNVGDSLNDPEHLHHSCTVIGNCRNQKIGALVKDWDYYVQVDAFNGAGIVHGGVQVALASGTASV